MNKELKQKWIDALRSGKYKQGTGGLKNTRDSTYCCLGVLCDISPGVTWETKHQDPYETAQYGLDSDDASLPKSLLKELNILTYCEGELILMNDTRRKSFNEIADYIEANL